MKFQPIPARENWRDRARDMGYLSWMFENPPYWIEALPQPFCAEFSLTEIKNTFIRATQELTELGLRAVETVCEGTDSDKLMERLRVPERFREPIRKSWKRKDPSLYGRFDFAYKDGELKLLEMNFDTALALYEASIFQLVWFEDLLQSSSIAGDQFNSLHQRLIAAFSKINLASNGELLHLACMKQFPEDWDTTQYIQSCAAQAGLRTKLIEISDLQYDQTNHLIDSDSIPVKLLFKLYPWQFLFADDSRPMLGNDGSPGTSPYLASIIAEGSTIFIEPPWKILLSSKAMLSIMWDLEPDCPWLLESRTDDQAEAELLKQKPHAKKPIFGMEGASVSLVYPGQPEKSFVNPGKFGQEGFVYQELFPLPKHENYHVLIGSWVIDGEPAGIGIRADKSPVTTANHCIFVPHFVSNEP